MEKLEYTTAKEFNPKFEERLKEMTVGESLEISFRDKDLLRKFASTFFKKLANTSNVEDTDYEHRIDEMTNSYVIEKIRRRI